MKTKKRRLSGRRRKSIRRRPKRITPRRARNQPMPTGEPSVIPVGIPTSQPSGLETMYDETWPVQIPAHPVIHVDKIRQNISTIISSIKDIINTPHKVNNGKWYSVFYNIIDQNNVEMMISADDKKVNIDAITNFANNLPRIIDDINNDLDQSNVSLFIDNLQVFNITKEEVETMSRDPNIVASDSDIIQEELDDWDSGIHKLIVFQYR